MTQPELLEKHPLWLEHRTDADLPYPDVIQLELTAVCDLACIMCPLPHESRHGSGNEKYEVADLERWRTVFAAASGVELTGFGEILCHPRLLDCLRWFRGLDLAVQATTNGRLLTPDLSQTILDENLIDVLCVSVDAATAKTYAQIRRQGDFSRLEKNLESLALKRIGRPLHFWLSFAAMAPNIRELPAFVSWAARLGVERIIVQHIYEAPYTNSLGLAQHQKLAASILQEAGATADESGIILEGRNMSEQGAAGYQPKMIKDCPFPWRHTFIKANRRVAACAMVWEDLDFGVLTDDFSAIWRGAAYQRFRGQMAGAEPPESCRRCRYFGWRPPVELIDVGPGVSMQPAESGRLGWGWHDTEYDHQGKPFRWSRNQASVFVQPRGHPVLEVEAVLHPQAPCLSGVVAVDKMEFPFDSHDLWGKPMRLPAGALPDRPCRIEIHLDHSWDPGRLGIIGHRKIGLLVYRIAFTGDADDYRPWIDAADPAGQFCNGWLESEIVGNKTARWTRERAGLLLPSGNGPLIVEARLPQGLSPRIVRLHCDGHDLGEQRLPADAKWHLLRFQPPDGISGLRRISLRIEGAAPIPGADSRRFGILVSGIGWSEHRPDLKKYSSNQE